MTWAVLTVAALILVAGGVTVASNMGFKLHKQWHGIGGVSPVGLNYVSIPYNHPYTSVNSFCTQVGLTSTGLLRAQVVIPDPSPAPSSPQIGCGTGPGSTALPSDGRGLVVRQTGAVTSGIIVGSHDPAKMITIPDSCTLPGCQFWFSIPYHTTAVTFGDFCTSAGLTSTGLTRAEITRADAALGIQSGANCGTNTANQSNLVLGEAIRVREPNGPKVIRPAHF